MYSVVDGSSGLKSMRSNAGELEPIYFVKVMEVEVVEAVGVANFWYNVRIGVQPNQTVVPGKTPIKNKTGNPAQNCSSWDIIVQLVLQVH